MSQQLNSLADDAAAAAAAAGGGAAPLTTQLVRIIGEEAAPLVGLRPRAHSHIC
jgi:hypothetical protein